MPPTIPQETISGTSSAADPQRELHTLLTSAAIAPLDRTGWMEITGSDRVRWLNGMVTNSVGDLVPGAGAYNFFLNAQGRIQGDGYIFAEPDRVLLETAASQLPNLLTLLDRFIIMDDVELADTSAGRQGLLLAGPQAADLLATLDLRPTGTAPSLTHLSFGDQPVTLIHAYSPLIPRFELWAEDIARLSAELQARGAAPCTPATLDLLRILEGTPLFGTDIRDRDLPQETDATRALHFSKGCYLGQEIVERIRSRGQVHRTFGGFTLSGALAQPGTPLTVEGKPAGELTTTAHFQTPAGDVQLALGYIRREFLVGSRPIEYTGGGATPSSVPFHASEVLSRTTPKIL